jgi:hypothetical protein
MSEESIPEPWWDLRTDGPIEAKQRDALRTELNHEVGAGHPLYGRGYSIIARSQARDDVLIALDDNNWAVVHLTWRQAPEDPPWPNTAVFDSLSEAIRSVAAN